MAGRPSDGGGVVIVHQGWRRALGVCEMGVVSLRFSCDVCLQGSGRGVAFPLVPPSSTSDEAMKPVVSSRPRRSCRVVSASAVSISPPPPAPPTPALHPHSTKRPERLACSTYTLHLPLLEPYLSYLGRSRSCVLVNGNVWNACMNTLNRDDL